MNTRAPVQRISYNAVEAAAAAGVSVQTIRKALRATDPASYPPPLRSRGRHGVGGRWAIDPADLTDWRDSLGRFG